MFNLLTIRRPQRLFTALVLLCYAWLCVVIPFQHHDCLTDDVVALGHQTDFATANRAAAPLNTRLAASVAVPSEVSHSGHCLACEWQSNLLSQALPVFTAHFVPSSREQVVTLRPRYLRRIAITSSSRGPPLA